MSDEEDRIAKWNRIPTQDEIDARLYNSRVPSIMLNKTAMPDGPGAPGCWFGGEPTLPPNIEWPYRPALFDAPSFPMHFLLQLDLTQVPRLAAYPDIPTTGTLFFFVEPLVAPLWGAILDGGYVIYVEDDVSTQASRPMPPLPDLSSHADLWSSDLTDATKGRGFKPWNLDFLVYEGYAAPNYHTDNDASLLHQAIRGSGGKVQDVLEAQTADRRILTDGSQEFVPHYLFGNIRFQTEWQLPDRTQLSPIDLAIPTDEPPRKLLAVAADEDFGYLPLHDGWIEYWIAAEDLRSRDFDKTFFVLRRN